MVKDDYVVRVDNPSNIYYPGQTVSGQLILDLDEPITVKSIVVKFKGKGFCSWTEGGGQNSRYYYGKEQYFAAWLTLVGKDDSVQNRNQQETVEIARGHHNYPFTFMIPMEKLPPSFESGCNNRVRYTIKAHIDKPWSLTHKVKHVINLVTTLDLNAFTQQNMMEPSEYDKSKQVCCFCCESNPISGFVRTERRGYVPGDVVVFTAEINNRSRRSIKWSKCQLVMAVTLISTSKRKFIYNKFHKIEHGSIPGGGTDVYMNERLSIPPVPPSYLCFASKVFDVKYYVMLVVKPTATLNLVYYADHDRQFKLVVKPTAALKLRVYCEIVVGSIPMEQVAAQYNVTLPPAISDGPLKGVRDHTALESIPQLSIEESRYGRFDLGFTRKKDGVEEYKETDKFIPKYPYFRWNQQNLADLFTMPKGHDNDAFQNYPRF